jgi:indole-3-glycerol phosphate synthase
MRINKLDAIIAHKHREVAKLSGHFIKPRISSKSFKRSLRNDQLAIISEIKRRSPSKGLLAEITDPVQLANNYISAGTNAISILTDELFFNGSLNDLLSVSSALQQNPTPILRKDFIIHPFQIDEAIMAGADAVLLMVSVLGDKTKELLDYCKTMNIDALVEIHTQKELDLAITIGSEIIGVNNRNLSTFEVDTNQAFNLIKYIPDHIIKVAESGILQPELAQQYYQAGFDAVLIGEALVKSSSPADFIGACRHED